MGKRRCSKCIMPEVDGHVIFDSEGVCNCCREETNDSYSTEVNEEYGIDALKELIATQLEEPHGKYDCIVAVSGGKDSIMCLHVAKEVLGLNPLAVYIDNGFGVPEMLHNIHSTVEKLDIDFISFRSNELRNIFKELLVTKKPIYYCRICHEMIDIYLREIAQKYDIRMLLGGYTKGQAYSRSSVLYWIFDKSDQNTIETLIQKPEFERIAEIVSNHAMYLYENFDSVYQINPFEYIDYNEQDIIQFLKENYDFRLPVNSWPKDSTNCLFNYISQYLAQLNFGYSQHETEISILVRNGEMKRERALELINTPITKEILEDVLAKLGLTIEDVL